MNVTLPLVVNCATTRKVHLSAAARVDINCKMTDAVAWVSKIKNNHMPTEYLLVCVPPRTDVDECLDAAINVVNLCEDNSECVNTEGSFLCPCVPGYEMVNETCTST